MPTPTCYTKSISSDFPNGKVNTSTLTMEINSSPILISLSHIDTEGDNCFIWFKDILSSEDESTLNNLVGAHGGEDTPNDVLKVQIYEEDVKTGGHFCTKSVVLLAEGESSASVDLFWPFPITALKMKMTTDETISYDTVDMSVGPNTTIGFLTSNSGSSPALWTNKNYATGEKVLYTVSSTYGQRVYTCIKSTTASQNPSDIKYWRFGYELAVSRTVLSATSLGYYITLSNESTNQNLNRLVYKTSNSIFVESAPTTNFSATSTSVKQTIYVLKDHYIGNGKIFGIGEGKIGGSSVPTDTVVNIKYSNNSTVPKRLLGFVEYLY
jgi:hypothetical protein